MTAKREFRGYKFLVTGIFVIEYGLQVVMPAVIHDTEPLSTILEICAAGIAAAFVVEFLLSPIGKSSARGIQVTPRSAMAVLIVGWFATLAGSLFGGIAYVNQITSAPASKVAAIFTPFEVWTLFGTALFFALARDGLVTTRRALGLATISFLLECGINYRGGTFGVAIGFGTLIVFLAVITGVVRLRWIVPLLAVFLLVAQPLSNLRNEVRASLSQVAEVQNQSWTQRVREDLLMAQVSDFTQIPTNFGYPSVGTLLRFGLLPRVLDRGRGNLNTGENFSVAVGGSSTNSNTATTFGDAYIEHKWPGVIFFGAAAAFVVGIITRRRGPWALALLAVIFESTLMIESTFPDMLAIILQTMLSMALAIVFSAILMRRGHRDVVRELTTSAWP